MARFRITLPKLQEIADELASGFIGQRFRPVRIYIRGKDANINHILGNKLGSILDIPVVYLPSFRADYQINVDYFIEMCSGNTKEAFLDSYLPPTRFLEKLFKFFRRN